MLSVGEFSRACMVSIKTLHHYDKIGLMHPQYTDRLTGYRYYEEIQISKMLLIQRMKRYGFSLAEIKFLLEEADERELYTRFKHQKQVLLDELTELTSIVDELSRHLQDFERTGDIMGYQNHYIVTLEQTEAIPILSHRERMSVEDFGKHYEKLFMRVMKEHLETDGETLAVYHDEEFNHESNDTEVALVMRKREQADRLLEGGLCATTIHYGGYSGLSDGYGAVVKWIQENGYRISGAPYEIYVKNQFDKLLVDKWETKIFIPVEKK